MANNLLTIRQDAMDNVNEPTNPSSGKWSVAWWNRRINRAKDVVAQEAGYARKRFAIPVYGNAQAVSLPHDFCWGILRVLWDGDALGHKDVYDLDDDDAGWEDADPGTPDSYMLNGATELNLSPAPTRTVIPGSVILAATSGAAFTNQPANDGVEVVSSDAGDTTQTIDIYGTTFRTNTVVKETVTLTGTTAASTTKTDWDYILGVELSAAATGTITVREASGNAQVTTISPGSTTSGISAISGAASETGEAKPRACADTSSAAIVGLVGTDEDGSAETDCCAALSRKLSYAQPMGDGLELISDGADTRTVTVYGTTFGNQEVVTETVTLNGAVQVATTKTDWGQIIEVEASTTDASRTITVREASGNLTIVTIPTSTTRVMVAPRTLVSFPKRMRTVTHVMLGAVPSATKVTLECGGALEVLGGWRPPDMTANSDVPYGLPMQFTFVLSDGAAALAEVSDLYGPAQTERGQTLLATFWAGVDKLKDYLGSLSRDRLGAIRLDTELYKEHYET